MGELFPTFRRGVPLWVFLVVGLGVFGVHLVGMKVHRWQQLRNIKPQIVLGCAPGPAILEQMRRNKGDSGAYERYLEKHRKDPQVQAVRIQESMAAHRGPRARQQWEEER